MEKKPSINKMKHYKDDCHHYKVIDDHRVVTIADVGAFHASISYDVCLIIDHHIIKDIKSKTVKPCTEAEYQTAFDKALNTIKNVK